MIKVKEFMVKNLITIDSIESAYAASEIMVKNNVSCVVVTEKSKPIGFATERNLVRKVLYEERNPKKVMIKDVMHKAPTVKPNVDFFSLVKFMRKENVRRVIVVEKGKLVGIVTETDVVNTSVKIKKDIQIKGSQKESMEVMERIENIQQGIRKMDTGYNELNSILGGGFPFHKSIILVGPPGSGKGLIAFNFMKTCLQNNNNVAYICMNEFIEDIEQLFLSLEIDIREYQDQEKFKIINMYQEIIKDQIRIYSDEEQLLIKEYGFIKKELDSFMKNLKIPTVCVVNMISQSMELYGPKTVYKFIMMLNSVLKENGVSTIFFMHKEGQNDEHITSMEEMMDGIIEFSIKKEGRKTLNMLEIKKMKPEFAVFPQVFTFKFDKRRNLSIERVKDV